MGRDLSGVLYHTGSIVDYLSPRERLALRTLSQHYCILLSSGHFAMLLWRTDYGTMQHAYMASPSRTLVMYPVLYASNVLGQRCQRHPTALRRLQRGLLHRVARVLYFTLRLGLHAKHGCSLFLRIMTIVSVWTLIVIYLVLYHIGLLVS